MTYSDSLFYLESGIYSYGLKVLERKVRELPQFTQFGTTDQHSQLQLYLDGPKDKFLLLLRQIIKIKALQ